jgi:hypothetical protein
MQLCGWGENQCRLFMRQMLNLCQPRDVVRKIENCVTRCCMIICKRFLDGLQEYFHDVISIHIYLFVDHTCVIVLDHKTMSSINIMGSHKLDTLQTCDKTKAKKLGWLGKPIGF